MDELISIYEQYVAWFESQDFYVDYLANLPSPLNSPGLTAIAVFVCGSALLLSVIGRISSWNFRRKMRKQARVLEETKMSDKIAEAARDRERKLEREAERDADRSEMRDMMKQYMDFMSMVQAQNAMGQMMSLRNLTFDQWQMQMYKQQANIVIDTPLQSEIDVKNCIDSVTNLLNREAYDRDSKRMDADALGIVTISANDAVDELKAVKSIADAIVYVWGELSTYRTGANKFTIMVTGTREKVTSLNIRKFRELVSDDGVNVAVGYADASNVKGIPTVEKLEKASAHAMQMDKESYLKAIEDKKAQEEAEEARIKMEEEAYERARVELEERLDAEKKAEEERARKEAEEKARQEQLERERLQAEEEAREKARLEEEARIEAEKEAEKLRKYAEERAMAEEQAKADAELVRAVESVRQKTDDEDLSSNMEQVAQPEDVNLESEITDEQESDFAKLVALMASNEQQKSQISSYNKKKSEATQKNAELLDGQLASKLEVDPKGYSNTEKPEEDALESKKKEALARIEAEKNQSQKKGFSLFGKK